MTCGVYEIVNTVNGKRYVGSSVDIEARWSAHRHRLRSGRHHSKHLQRAWNKHGESAFVFSIIQECGKPELLGIEQQHIDSQSEYNIMPIAGRNTGYKHTDEAREKMSEAQARIWTEDKRESVSNKSLETWSREDVKEKVRKQRSSDTYSSQKSAETLKKWSDPDYRKKTTDALKSESRRKNCSVSFRSYETYTLCHDDHGEVTASQWDMRETFPYLNASGLSQLCSGKQAKHKGWTIKKAPEGA